MGGHSIPNGTLTLWSPHLAGRDPDSWVDPDQFGPERFADLEPTASHPPAASGLTASRPVGGVPM